MIAAARGTGGAPGGMGEQSNFAFLRKPDPELFALGWQAERLFAADAVACITKLRLFCEFLAVEVAGLFGIDEPDQHGRLRALEGRAALTRDVAQLFHSVRTRGNDAIHANIGDHRTALSCLKHCRQLAIWYLRGIKGRADFKAGPFVPPADPANETEALRDELDRLRSERDQARQQYEEVQSVAQGAAEERDTWQALAEEAEARIAKTAPSGMAEAPIRFEAQPADIQAQLVEASQAASAQLDIDEAETRRLIDEQLRAVGWTVDTETLTYSKGSRPQKNRDLAIAEWPTANGPADYALFAGHLMVGIVEAKRRNKNVAAYLTQAERYSAGVDFAQGGEVPGGPWGDYAVPFVFSSNGRPYLKQIEELSGIWFRDARKPGNLGRALDGWYSPDGLKKLLEQDHEAAHEQLRSEPMEYEFGLRDYQQAAVRAVETGLEKNRQRLLLAMATGTGKTKTCVALVYRLLSAKRFRRILFLVDRNILGEQAATAFKETRIVGASTFADIFGIKELADQAADPETKVQIATIQSMVKRVLYAEDDADIPPVDEFDCIVVDECHRGYLLDRELGDQELSFRDQADYVSKYSRVIDHFDAVKIGLTATPALHTSQLFGDPIFTYAYREAVVDGWLVDHEPPYRIMTALARLGIQWDKGEELEILNPVTGQVDLTHAPDDLGFEVESFNRKVLTRPFNRVVCEELARHIDPTLDGKTLIFCATDLHADIVVTELRKAFADRYGDVPDEAVRKITGNTDRPRDLARRFRNNRMPNVAVTVDLLTTGFDAPKIVNLVYIRRVASRILFDQMMGRATRLCDEIGKEVFRIFDAVDLYKSVGNMTDMKPVAADPRVTFNSLIRDLGRVTDAEMQTEIRDQLVARMRRRAQKMSDGAATEYQQATGETVSETIERLESASIDDVTAWIAAHSSIADILDRAEKTGVRPLFVSHHEDELEGVERGYGSGQKPEDYLDGFAAFLRDNMNKIPALTVVATRPRDLTRQQLRGLRLALETEGYRERDIQAAWRERTNEDIAASIIGFIRGMALGDPLVPYAERVDRAMRAILSRGDWTDPQRQWLDRIAQQLKKETVVDREALNTGEFERQGGYERLNRIFDGQLETVLDEIGAEMWREAS